MTNLTPEHRAELRRTLDLLIPARYEAMNMPTAEILALLDAADERDRLLTVADTLGRVNGEYAMEIHRCREALGVDEDTDPHHAAQALAAAVERVRALADHPALLFETFEGRQKGAVSADDLHRALDGTEDPT